ncbi:MAG: Na+:solute symporter [Melioribacter sp.]|uniref:sodium:solute symporter family protein n=1 Tax=Rosettibacter primus TaxID=3111523 RepID=UPI00247C4648|nr:Na+:solute symporter [Melioribacter sp.]
MHLHIIDITIILLYLTTTIFIGFYISKRASKDIHNYFLGGNRLPWWMLGVSDASGMFDIAGTMLIVYWLSVYGLKSMWIPWIWPVFNQIFLMVYLSPWLRRSNVMTGAEWIKTRFGTDKGATLSHFIVVIYALISVIGFLSYGFKGIGKFAAAFLPPIITNPETLVQYPQINANLYALILMGLTTLYVVKGGMMSVVATEVLQYCILSVSAIAIGIIAMYHVSPEMINSVIPEGWKSMAFGWNLGLDWSTVNSAVATKVKAFNNWIANDGYSLFGLFFGMMLFKGFFVAAAGPAPNYDMQRILSTRSPKEAAKMNSLVSVVLNPTRYFMAAGLTVLALTNFDSLYKSSITSPDFEAILPEVLANYVPAGLLGLLMAGFIAAFMSNFAATVNAAPAYIVNDIYKRYIKPNAEPKKYVKMSYLASLGVVIVGISIGFFVESINQIALWIVASLWGGYTAANVLKWYWWRFNGYGYFWGMVAGMSTSLILLLLEKIGLITFINNWPLPANPSMNSFPIIFFNSIVGCVVATLLTKPEDDTVLMKFYHNVRPWGFWKPIYEKVKKIDPQFEANKNFKRDMFNILVGMAWQITLMCTPVFLVIREFKSMLISLSVLLITSLILKLNWWNKLEENYGQQHTELIIPAIEPALVEEK